MKPLVAVLCVLTFIGCGGQKPQPGPGGGAGGGEAAGGGTGGGATGGGAGGGTPTNSAPVLGDLSAVTIDEGSTLDVPLAAADADGDSLTFDVANNPAFVTLTSKTLHVAPGFDAVTQGTSSTFDITVSVTDGQAGHSVSGTLHLTVNEKSTGVTGTVSINSDAKFTKNSAVTLALTGSSAAGAISQMRFSNDGTTFSAFEAFAATKSWTLDATADGLKTVTVELKDAAGESKQLTATITLDTAAPTISGFTIDNGATATKSGSVLLTVSATDNGSGIATIEASNDGTTFSGVSSNPANWALPSADGNDTVTVRVTDAAGNSATTTASIIRDGTAPTITTATLNGGTTWSRANTVSLQVAASDGTGSGLWQLCVSGDVAQAACFSYTSSAFQLALSSGDGQKQVSVTVVDNVGNISSSTLATVSVDATPPAAQSLTIDNGAAATNNLTLTMTTAAADPAPGSGLSTIEFSSDLLNWSTPQAYATSINVTVPAGDGARTFYARLTDVAGNVSVSPYTSATIKIDQTPPSGGTVVINSNATYANTTAVSLALTGTDATSSVTNACIKSGTMPLTMTPPSANDPCWATPFSATVSYTLTPTADGNQRVFVWLRDAAGNILTTPFTDDIFLDRQTPSTPANASLVSVSYRTITLALGTLSTDPGGAQSSGLSYQVGFRFQGSTAPFTYMNPSGSLVVNLSAANAYELVVRAVDGAGNASAPSNSVLASTYFLWTSEYHTPFAQPNSSYGAGVIGAGGNFVVGYDYGADYPLSFIDNGDGLATMKRMDVSLRTVASVGNTSRALFINNNDARFTTDVGATIWPLTYSPSPGFN
ncbi:MAG: Ig-like domain-containing protein, partial [Myxococcaceae bacterium]